MPKLKLSNEELQAIITDYNNGISMDKITKKYHHDKNTLKRYFQEHNVDIKLRNRAEAMAYSMEVKKANALKKNIM